MRLQSNGLLSETAALFQTYYEGYKFTIRLKTLGLHIMTVNLSKRTPSKLVIF